MQESDREHRHDDRRRDRHQAEHRHQPGVQTRAGEALPAGHDQLDEAARHHRAEQQQEDQIEVERPSTKSGSAATFNQPEMAT